MYNSQTVKNITVIVVIAAMFVFCGKSYWFDLISEIANKFQKPYNEGITDKYLEMPYVSVYSKDPFGDQLKSTSDMKTQLKLAWVDMVEQALANKNCKMAKKKIRWILYYYVPEFRMDIARTLKMEIWDTDSKKFILDRETALEYCIDYFKCEKLPYWNFQDVTARSSDDVETNCRDFFQKYYEAGQENEEKDQTVKKSQLWNDKYRNSSVDDSPYDIMSDLWVIWKLLFEDAQPPLQPVFYHLPIFRNSEKSIKNNKDTAENKTIWTQWWQWVLWWDNTQWENWKQQSDWSVPTISVTPLPWWERTLTIEEIDRLIEWLWAYNKTNNEIVKGKVCGDEEEAEPEPAIKSDFWKGWRNDAPSDDWIDRTSPTEYSDMTEWELKDLMDYLQSVVDAYSDLSKDKEKEMKEKAWDTKRYSKTTESQLENAAKEIKNCWDGCKWLRLDQQMSCRIMCACGEIDSPIFNPEETEGLWPLFKINFCTVPAENAKFSVWWRKIMSIEEWIKEIYGAVDKLSREWKLWMWTQQYNFLDSSTKKMNVANTFAFSIDIEWVDIANDLPNYSRQYKQYISNKNNEKMQKSFSIKYPTDDYITKNAFALLARHSYIVDDFSSLANSELSRNDKADLTAGAEGLADLNSDSDASRYASMVSNLDVWLEQQAELWTTALWFTRTFDDHAVLLNSKREKSEG